MIYIQGQDLGDCQNNQVAEISYLTFLEQVTLTIFDVSVLSLLVGCCRYYLTAVVLQWAG
jgi:hypothetical protein